MSLPLPKLPLVLLGLLFAAPAAAGVLDFRFAQENTEIPGLGGPVAVALSPDGAHVYVAALADSSLVVFARDGGSGGLTWVETQLDGVAGVDGLGGAAAVAVSPDGAHVYAAGSSDGAVAVFERNPLSGALRFVEQQKDGVAGVDGLAGVAGVALGPGGEHLYAAGSGDDALAVFARHPTTGALSFVELQRDGVNGVDGLAGATAVQVSSDGNHVYAASTADSAIAAFSRNPTTGALGFVEAQQDGVNGVDGLALAIALAISPDGLHVYAAGRADDAVAAFSRDAGTGALSFVELQRDGVNGVDGLAGASGVAVSPDGAHLYATGNTDQAVAVFSRNAGTGALGFVEAQQEGAAGVVGLEGPYGVAVSPDGADVYATALVSATLVAFDRSPGSGALAFLQRLGPIVEGLAGASSTRVSADGRHVYVAGRFDDAVPVFERDPASGLLEFLGAAVDGVDGVDGIAGALSVALSPDGRHLYAAGLDDDAVAAFERDPQTGLLDFVGVVRDGVGGVDGLDGAFHVTVSPDGAHVYAAARFDDAVAIFERDLVTGALGYLGLVRDGVGGVDGLDGVRSVALDPSGSHLYTASTQDDAVSVFSRDATSGALTFVEVQRDGVNGVDGLMLSFAAIVSPDGAHVYSVSVGDDAIAAFSRHPSTGALTFIEAQFDGVDGVDGLGEASAVIPGPDGAHLYVSSQLDDAVAVFARDATTGRLAFLEAEFDGVNGVTGLLGARFAAPSPDGRHVYVAGRDDGAVVLFATPLPTPAAPPWSIAALAALLLGLGARLSRGASATRR